MAHCLDELKDEFQNLVDVAGIRAFPLLDQGYVKHGVPKSSTGHTVTFHNACNQKKPTKTLLVSVATFCVLFGDVSRRYDMPVVFLREPGIDKTSFDLKLDKALQDFPSLRHELEGVQYDPKAAFLLYAGERLSSLSWRTHVTADNCLSPFHVVLDEHTLAFDTDSLLEGDGVPPPRVPGMDTDRCPTPSLENLTQVADARLGLLLVAKGPGSLYVLMPRSFREARPELLRWEAAGKPGATRLRNTWLRDTSANRKCNGCEKLHATPFDKDPLKLLEQLIHVHESSNLPKAQRASVVNGYRKGPAESQKLHMGLLKLAGVEGRTGCIFTEDTGFQVRTILTREQFDRLWERNTRSQFLPFGRNHTNPIFYTYTDLKFTVVDEKIASYEKLQLLQKINCKFFHVLAFIVDNRPGCDGKRMLPSEFGNLQVKLLGSFHEPCVWHDTGRHDTGVSMAMSFAAVQELYNAQPVIKLLVAMVSAS